MREMNSTYEREIGEDELYRLYLEFIEQSRDEIEARTVPGSFRDRLLKHYRQLPREHFEARLDSLRASPADYAAAVASLRRGFLPSE